MARSRPRTRSRPARRPLLADAATTTPDVSGEDQPGQGVAREVVVALHAEVGGDEHHTSTGLSNEKLGMWVFLGSDCLLFGGLISTYLLYRDRSRGGPTPEDVFDIPFTSVSSFVLLMSSLTMVLALSALLRGDERRNRIWLLTTALLGATFIAGQVF